jgi:hypothetical protein
MQQRRGGDQATHHDVAIAHQPALTGTTTVTATNMRALVEP